MSTEAVPSGDDGDMNTQARRLGDRWRAGDRTDPAFRAACARVLGELRSAWRLQPAAFSSETVGFLRAIALEVAARPVSGRPVSARPVSGPPPIEILRDVFGYPSFRAGQQEIIDAILSGRDCVGIMPTGAGKSLTYQIPARILGGTTLVVSPLIALMKDQVDAMNEVGLRATYLSA